MTNKILHIATCANFIPPFINNIKKHFNFDEHDFLLISSVADDDLVDVENVKLSSFKTLRSKLNYYFAAIVKMHQADKIILHSLFNQRLTQILFFTPWLLKKCYWIMWGGDLYAYQFGVRSWKWYLSEFFRRPVIKNMGYLVTYVEGDVELARKWYRAKGKYCECLMYPSNLYKEYKIPDKKSETINIQVGNSADPSNNHIEVLEKLLPYKKENILIYLPLSYGSSEHAENVIAQGREWFGNKFKAITDSMSLEDYLAFLGTIDIAIFNHERQQAMGNTITLLGLGKTVYLRSGTTQWQLFKEKKLVFGDVGDLANLDFLDTRGNIDVVKAYFSEGNYNNQLAKIFG